MRFFRQQERKVWNEGEGELWEIVLTREEADSIVNGGSPKLLILDDHPMNPNNKFSVPRLIATLYVRREDAKSRALKEREAADEQRLSGKRVVIT